jgi:hypothetical protein
MNCRLVKRALGARPLSRSTQDPSRTNEDLVLRTPRKKSQLLAPSSTRPQVPRRW